MKIINRYVLKEHLGPFVFALSALTSLLLLQYIGRKFGDLVGKGLRWQVVAEFFVLAIPFTVAMTLPMAVLVAALYAFSRLAAENEITALKAGGISSRKLMVPALIAATMLAVLMVIFNDQLLPRTNHRLAGLQMDILRTKPTFALREQVINPIREGQLYLRAGHIDEGTSHLRDVEIYDTFNQSQRRTIYANTAVLTLAANERDLTMHLYKGMMLSVAADKPGQLTRIDYGEDLLKVRDVAGALNRTDADSVSKGEREMSVCEMQREFTRAVGDLRRAQADFDRSSWRQKPVGPEPKPVISHKPPGGIGALYCSFTNSVSARFRVKPAAAAELHQDTTKRRAPPPPQGGDSVIVLVNGVSTKVPRNHIPPGASFPASDTAAGIGAVRHPPAPPAPAVHPLPPMGAVAGATTSATLANPPGEEARHGPPPVVSGQPPETVISSGEMTEVKMRLDEARRRHNRYSVEIEKKFSLAAACIVFVLVGAPIALRFPHGGVGLVIGVSFLVFATYYVALIGGEELANRAIITPFWAMWGANIIFVVAGGLLILRMGHEANTARGGGNLVERLRGLFDRKRPAT